MMKLAVLAIALSGALLANAWKRNVDGPIIDYVMDSPSWTNRNEGPIEGEGTVEYFDSSRGFGYIAPECVGPI